MLPLFLIFTIQIAFGQVNNTPPDWVCQLANQLEFEPVTFDEITYLSDYQDGFGNLNLNGFIDYAEKKFILFLAKKKSSKEFYYVFATNEYLKTDKYVVESIFKADQLIGIQYLIGKMRGNFDLSEFVSLKDKKTRGPKGFKVEASWINPIVIPSRPPITLIYINNEWFKHSLEDW